MADLELHLQDRVKAIADGLIEEAKITQTGMQAVIDIINTYVGPGGIAEGIYDYFVLYAQTAMAAAMGAVAALSGFNNMQFLPDTIPSANTHAQGGIEVANKPTAAIYGEAGPELAIFLPLRGSLAGLASSKNNKLPDTQVKGQAGEKGKLQIEVALGAGLEGRIIDKTMDRVADVVLTRVR